MKEYFLSTAQKHIAQFYEHNCIYSLMFIIVHLNLLVTMSLAQSGLFSVMVYTGNSGTYTYFIILLFGLHIMKKALTISVNS